MVSFLRQIILKKNDLINFHGAANILEGNTNARFSGLNLNSISYFNRQIQNYH